MVQVGAPCTFVEAVNQQTKKSRLLSLREAGMLEDIRTISERHIWTRTIVAYPAKDSSFGYGLRIINRPFEYYLDTSSFRDRRGIALVFEDFDLNLIGRSPKEEVTRRAVEYLPQKVQVIERFPQESGWYSVEGITLPVTDEGKDFFLWRSDAATVGPAVLLHDREGTTNIFLNRRYSEKLIPVFVPYEMSASSEASVVSLAWRK